jgi:FtsZ-binding cell division protein ZapB
MMHIEIPEEIARFISGNIAEELKYELVEFIKKFVVSRYSQHSYHLTQRAVSSGREDYLRLQAEIDHLRAQSSYLAIDNGKLRSQNKQLTSENDQLKEDIEFYSSYSASQETDLNKANETIEQLSAELSCLKSREATQTTQSRFQQLCLSQETLRTLYLPTWSGIQS